MSKGSLRRPTLNKEQADKNWDKFMQACKLANRKGAKPNGKILRIRPNRP